MRLMDTSAYMNLISPPLWTTDIGGDYNVKAGISQPGFFAGCLNKPNPLKLNSYSLPDIGRLPHFEFVNNTASPTPDPVDEKFWIDMYLTDRESDTGRDSFFKWDQYVWGGARRMKYWQGLETGWRCSVPLDMKSRLKQPGNETAVGLLEGMNITIALLTMLGRGPYRGDLNWSGDNWEEVDQCAYITLTSKPIIPKRGISEVGKRDANLDMCNRVNLDWFATPTKTSSTLLTATSSVAAGNDRRPSANFLLGGVTLAALGTN